MVSVSAQTGLDLMIMPFYSSDSILYFIVCLCITVGGIEQVQYLMVFVCSAGVWDSVHPGKNILIINVFDLFVCKVCIYT